MTTSAPRWLDLEGADNVRDLGGLPTADGRSIAPGRLIRADSLQDLTAADVRYLVDELHVTDIADLRTRVEVAGEGPGPMMREPSVRIQALSLLREPDDAGVAVAAVGDDEPVVLPWNDPDRAEQRAKGGRGVSGVYLGYLDERPESVLGALRLVAGSQGAAIVHCAAGKDRTGTVVALALAEIGVPREEIVADYARSAERVEAVLGRLIGRRTYATDLIGPESIDKHRPKPQTMERLLDALEAHGGASGWLRANGWTEDDAAALRRKLLG